MGRITIGNGVGIIVVLIIILLNTNLYSQTDIPTDTIAVDSAEAARLGLFNKENRKTFKIIFSGKPTEAALFSLFLPGAGQAYNGRYWKMPIVWGLIGYFGYNAFRASKEYRDIDYAYRCMLRNENCSYKGITDSGQLAPYRLQARSLRDRMWVTFTVVYLIQAVEAYIDRHLIDFDMSKDLTIKPGFSNGGINLGFSYNINGNGN